MPARHGPAPVACPPFRDHPRQIVQALPRLNLRAVFAAAWLVAAAGLGRAQTLTTPPPAEQMIMYQGEATSILGRPVRDPAGDTVGRIIDVLVDEGGQPRAAVIDFGGFMGLGNRKIAVVWRALHFLSTAENGQIQLDMTADQIKAIPEFHRSRPSGPQPSGPPVTVAAPPAPSPPPER